MSEKEKNAIKKIWNALPHMSDFQLGRLYGFAEAMEEQNLIKEKEDKENER